MYYFDNAATTKPSKLAIDTYNLAIEKYWYNASSKNKLGISTTMMLEDAKAKFKEVLNLENKEVIFLSGATEANNLAIYGICNKYLNQKKHLITTKIEHPSVYNCFKDLENKDFKVTYLDVNANGVIDLNQLDESLSNDTIIVSIIWVNNIVGSIQPIREIIKICKKYPRVKLHVDMVQGIGKIPVDFNINDIDLITITAHKIHGLKGCGALIMNDKITLSSLIKGGSQQKLIRPGTIDVPAILSFVKVLENAILNCRNNYLQVLNVYQYLISNLLQFDNIIINSPPSFYSPYIINISFKNIRGETALHFLETNQVYVGTSSACITKENKADKTIIAMTNNGQRAINAIRISLSNKTTKEDIDFLLRKIQELERI